jgi:hypothetical protein
MVTTLNTTDRYVAPETAKHYWVVSMTDYTAPLFAELDAGVDITSEVSTAEGFEVAADNVAVPDGGTLYTAQIPGRINPGDASIAFYASRDTDDVRTVIERGDAAYVVVFHGGNIPGQLMDVFPVRVRSVSKPIDYTGSNATMVTIQFSITRVPAENVTIPAA